MKTINPNRFVVIFLMTMAVASVTAQVKSPEKNVSEPFLAAVVWVHDGDTLTVRSNGIKYLVRLWGIDAPEKDQPGGKEATKFLMSLTKRRTLKIIPVDSDIYGRLVAQIYSGKKYINLEMLKAGHAWWYEKYAPDEKTFKEAEEKARSDKKGLWNDPTPVNPKIWRKKKTSTIRVEFLKIRNALMPSLGIIKKEIAVDSFSEFRQSFVMVQIQILVFQTAPQAFGKNVVQRASFACHAYFY
jgi:endonuclease YncB( thermonuclease family)